MALILPQSRFLHIPKTGGTWVRCAVEAANIPFVETGWAHSNLNDRLCGERQFTFAFVRYPLTWWRSYWLFRQKAGWWEGYYPDCIVQSNDLNTYLSEILDKCYGHYSELVTAHVGPIKKPIDYIGKFENLQYDLTEALMLAGEKFDPQVFATVPRVNESDYASHNSKCSVELAWKIIEAEQEVIKRFGYDDVHTQEAIRQCT